MSYFNIKHHETHSGLHGTVIPIDDLKLHLSQFRLGDVMRCLSRLNILLTKGRLNNNFDEIQRILVVNFFDAETIEKIESKFGGKVKSSPVFFTRHLMLYLMKLAANVCSDSEEGMGIDSDEERWAFGQCCLWATDHIETKDDRQSYVSGSVDDQRRELSHRLATNLELSGRTEIPTAVTRADTIRSRIIPSPTVRQKSGSFNLEETFETVTGLTFKEFIEFIFLIVSWYHVLDINELMEEPNKFVIGRSQFISDTVIEESSFGRIIDLLSIPIEDLPNQLGAYIGGAYHQDFTPLRIRPLLKLPNGDALCFDLEFLVDWLSSGIYLTITNHFIGADRGSAKTAFGYIFEEYINQTFRSVYPQPASSVFIGPFVASPYYQRTRDEAFDSILISPQDSRHVYIFQYKSQFLPPQVEYGGDTTRFENKLDHKGMFGIGKKGGVTQLVNNIKILWDDDPTKRDSLRNVDLSRIEIVTPILVVQESFFKYPLLNWTLNNRLQVLLATAGISPSITIKPLVVVDIDSLERLRPYLTKGICTFAESVNSLIADDIERKASYYEHLFGFLKQHPEVNDDETMTHFRAIMERCRLLFKDQPPIEEEPST